jgi:hypothetical protein
MRTVIVLALAVVIALLSSKATSNEIYITQSGNNLDLEVQQRSEDNYVSLNSNGGSNNITIRQGMHDDGTIDLDETGGHEAYWTITGSNNDLGSYQTDTNRGGGGGAAHHLANIVNGDGNSVSHTQMGKAGHDGFIEIQGDNNNVDLYQRGNGGQQWADVVLTGDGHTVDANQRGTMAHSFEVDLTNSGGAYSLTSNQTTNNTTTSKSYSLTGICTNSNGCSVNVTQN